MKNRRKKVKLKKSTIIKTEHNANDDGIVEIEDVNNGCTAESEKELINDQIIKNELDNNEVNMNQNEYEYIINLEPNESFNENDMDYHPIASMRTVLSDFETINDIYTRTAHVLDQQEHTIPDEESTSPTSTVENIPTSRTFSHKKAVHKKRRATKQLLQKNIANQVKLVKLMDRLTEAYEKQTEATARLEAANARLASVTVAMLENITNTNL